MTEICDNSLCTGCAACYSACPEHCITMCADEEGFLFPKMEDSKCIKCGICKKICPVNFERDTEKDQVELPPSYAAISNNAKILRAGSSGGIFGVLAAITLNNGGVVFGAAYDQNFEVRQIKIVSLDELYKLQGSKYVQSAVGDSYKQAKAELDNGIRVLYSGTPCQIAGLKRYLRKTYENLTTVDILCHGVPNQTLFTSYIKYLENKHNGKVASYSFRDKEKWGWGNWGSVKFLKKNGKYKALYFPVDSDYFYSLYFKQNCFRESCYNCPFAKIPRQGDFTIGDLWGAEELKFSRKQYRNGISLVFVNNSHAQISMADIKQASQIIACDAQWAIAHNKTAVQATSRPDERDTFYLDFAEYGFEGSAKRYCKLKYIVPYVSRYLPSGVKKAMKTMARKLKIFRKSTANG